MSNKPFLVNGLKLAVPTKGKKLLTDRVADTFSRAPTLTIVTIHNGKIRESTVINNSAKELTQGAGPMVASMMKENDVDVVLTGDIGPGASKILQTMGIEITDIGQDQKVKHAINHWLESKTSYARALE
jgi:predicted Fe-Mo cluster-binding NifX family protein